MSTFLIRLRYLIYGILCVDIFFLTVKVSIYLLVADKRVSECMISMISIYTLSDLGVLSNLIGSLSLANGHYSPPTE